MSAPTSTRSKNEWLIQHPERVSDALANVILQEGPREVILGQAWLAAPGRMITCGHVVERFAGNPLGLYVKFPSSGNVYPVQMVRLHPSFVRQPDQLVKFDVALLEVNFAPPESAAIPLPFSYEQPLHTNQTLWVIRYPTHLAQLSAATQPLTQDGKFLGPLRKHDSFHLLHDLPLAPGDSGAPITDGNLIMAVHCGDTATLPGLNLPTTSIRLALWVDALRELGLNETVKPGSGGSSVRLGPAIGAFLVSLIIGAGVGYGMLSKNVESRWSVGQAKVAPVSVAFNEPRNGYKKDQEIQIELVPHSSAYVYLFQVTKDDQVVVLYPQRTTIEQGMSKGEKVTIERLGTLHLTANATREKLLLVAIDSESRALREKVLPEDDLPPVHKIQPGPNDDPIAITAKEDMQRFSQPLKVKGKDLLARIRSLKQQNPESIIYSEFDAPYSI